MATAYTIEYCDERIREFTERIEEHSIDEKTGKEYIDLWLDHRLEVMAEKGGVKNENPALA